MIFDKLNHLLSPIANAVLAFIAFLQAHQLALALLSGVMLPFIFSAKHGGQEKPTFLQRILILLSMICFVFGSIAPVAVWFLQ
ncbi:TPA: MFS transporter, partial [Klebsiella pneumoniae]|nr:MFS transporter [Klebsiella pneumoniae]